jgi:hypothetical protein
MLDAIAQCTHLKELNISDCNVCEQGVASCAQMLESTALEELSLAWNTIKESGAKRLGHSLSVNESLKRLDLSSCGLGDAGGTYVAKGLLDNAVLEVVLLSSNSLALQTCDVLADLFTKITGASVLKQLWLQENNFGFEGGMKLFGPLVHDNKTSANRLPEMHTEGCNFNATTGAVVAGAGPFNPNDCNGHYKLDLANEKDASLAVALVKLRNEEGPASWHHCQVGIALHPESNDVGAVLLGSGFSIKEGDSVKATGKIAQIPVGEAFLIRVVDALAAGRRVLLLLQGDRQLARGDARGGSPPAQLRQPEAMSGKSGAVRSGLYRGVCLPGPLPGG